MTTGTTDITNLGPARFRIQADNNREQICYYNRNKRDKSFNSFLVVRKQTSQANKIIFSIVNLIDKTNRNNNIFFEINDELRDFDNDNVQSKRPIQRYSEVDIARITGRKQQQHTTRSDGRVGKTLKFLSK